MTDTLVPSSRQTLRSEVLHLLEDATFESSVTGLTVKALVERTEKSETTIRKAVKDLVDGGFIAKHPNDPTSYHAITKYEVVPETPGGGDTMPTKTKTPVPAPVKTGKGGRPKDPAVQARDQEVLAFIKVGGATVGQIAEKFSTTKSLAYISVWRLKTAGLIKKTASGTRAPIWQSAK